jgi:ATP-dependent RNA helicase DDX3X
MTNAVVNGSSGLESQFGMLSFAFFFAFTVFTIFIDSMNLSKSTYVPPHMRSQQRAASTPSPTPRNGWNDSRGGSPSSRGGYDRSRGGSSPFSATRGGGQGWGERTPSQNWTSTPREQPRESQMFGYGAWKDGQHIVGGRNQRMEKEIFGEANDPSKQHTGINFEKYDDIPVEATGADVPEPVTSFTSPPLDAVLLENISYARYETPTPVQKYSIPIVANGRDLMACAQVGNAHDFFSVRQF